MTVDHDARLTAPAGEHSTRDRVLELVVSDGPVSAADLGLRLDLTSAAIRRHIASLESDGLVTVHESGHTGQRGRPARRYVATGSAQDSLAAGYSQFALQVMNHLEAVGGPSAVTSFAATHVAEREARYAEVLTATDPAARVQQLAEALTEDGFVASVRPVPGTQMVQLCQGHCPVQHVAARYPQLCDAEIAAFSRLLGTHVQRLSTLAGGAHVCTTNIPVGPPPGVPPDDGTAAHAALVTTTTGTHHRPTGRTAEGMR
ncbi:metalloregulator ArsR/SmtB family transcription factor [Sanguibacter sp. HDW7]|uniref:helix-turn-helix transcriptional regulator n=1 Tax=Sanguibacter sp. HDW7 TaxID=2714931 RepID=UPI0014080817|nr:helix-turn-helix domain-containing protein [Sanguibacter sp. HDW7]QIK83378.1 helix-turn-helix domain-containing protein [Sanguibacter sp. HDW7]